MSQSEIENLFIDLRTLSNEDISNPEIAKKIATIKEKIKALQSTVNKDREAEEKLHGREYLPKLGAYIDFQTKEDKLKYQEYVERQKNQPKKPETTIHDKPYKSQIEELDPFEKKHVQDPITDKQYYSNIQVKHLIGQNNLPAGSGELKVFLLCNQYNITPGKPFTFAYLIVDENDASQNHFVSISIRKVGNKTEVTYIDSNGELISDKDRASVMQALPNAEIKYVSHKSIEKNAAGEFINGDLIKISEAEAKAHPEQPLRVQFDEYNCGAYAKEITCLMRHAHSGEDMVRGLDAIKNMDMQAVRQKHTNDIAELITKGTMQNRYAAYEISDDVAKAARNIVGSGITTNEIPAPSKFSESVGRSRNLESRI
jgi:hypothetical protein